MASNGHAHDHSHRAHKGRVWTYLILATCLVLAAVIGNLVMNNPDLASRGVDAFLGLPPWAFPTLGAALGLVLFYVGLKIESDWPERLGALLVAGSIAGGEFLLGWQNFELGGLKVVPYVIPAFALLVLLMISNAKSR